MLQDYLSGGRLPTFLYPSAVDNFKRQFIHLEGGGTYRARMKLWAGAIVCCRVCLHVSPCFGSKAGRLPRQLQRCWEVQLGGH